jgi:hypothetical protein
MIAPQVANLGFEREISMGPLQLYSHRAEEAGAGGTA